MLSNINFLTRAATKPAIIVPKVHAMRVKSPVGVKYRSIPPIKPAIKPAGHPKMRPADKGDALLTFKTAPSRGTPYSVAEIATSPKEIPIIICFGI